jgi:hypothetical protein
VLRRVAMEREPKEAELSVITANMDRLGEAMREMDGKLSQILRQTELNH